MKWILFLLISIPTLAFSQSDSLTPQLYFGDAGPGEMCDKSSRVISIHLPGEDGHDEAYTIIAIQFVVDGLTITSPANTYDPAQGYILSSSFDKGMEAQESGTQISIVAKVRTVTGATQQFVGVYEVR